MSCWDCVDCQINKEFKRIAKQENLVVKDGSLHSAFKMVLLWSLMTAGICLFILSLWFWMIGKI